MSTRDDWLDEGLRVLADEGAPGLRTDRIAARLGLTKGSFFHHFRGAADYRRALLVHYRDRAIAQVGAATNALADAPPEAAFAGLRARAADLLDQPLETAVRAWAFQDDDARAAQGAIDAARLDALTSVWARLVGEGDEARVAALVPHLVVIGATMALPATDAADLDRVFGLLEQLVPHVRRSAGG